MLSRRDLLAGLLVVPALSSTALAQGEGTSVLVGAALDDETTPLLYAEQSGLFRRAGLNVDVQRFTSGSAIAAAVAGGSLQAGKVGTMAAITAHARGLNFQLIAPVASWNSDAKPHRGVIVAVDSPIHNARDFNGKTIAVSSLGDLDAFACKSWVDEGGGDSKTLKFLELPPTAVPAAIDQGRIDAGVQGEPLLSTSLATKKYRVAATVFDAIGRHWEVAVILARADWIASNQATVAKFTEVVHNANVYVSNHESQLTPLIAQFIGLDPATVTNMVHPTRSPYLTAAAIQPVIDIAFKYGAIPTNFSAADLVSPYALKPPR